MDFIEQLHQEHERLAYMMDELLNLEDGARNSHNYLDSFQRIIAHEGSEEEAIYGLISVNPELSELADRGHREQLEIRKAIEDLNAITSDNQRWPELLGELKNRMVAHFRTEEEALFPKLREGFSPADLAEMGETYNLAHKALDRPPSRIVNRV